MKRVKKRKNGKKYMIHKTFWRAKFLFKMSECRKRRTGNTPHRRGEGRGAGVGGPAGPHLWPLGSSARHNTCYQGPSWHSILPPSFLSLPSSLSLPPYIFSLAPFLLLFHPPFVYLFFFLAFVFASCILSLHELQWFFIDFVFFYPALTVLPFTYYMLQCFVRYVESHCLMDGVAVHREETTDFLPCLMRITGALQVLLTNALGWLAAPDWH